MNKKSLVSLTVAMLFLCISANAQSLPNWQRGQLSKQGKFIAVNGQKLDQAQTLALVRNVGGEALAQDWKSAASKRGAGLGLTIGGFTVGAIGLGVTVAGGIVGGMTGAAIGSIDGTSSETAEKTAGAAATPGYIITGLGLAAGITGVILLINGNSALTNIIDTCNTKGPGTGVNVSLGATQNGIGLALRF